MMLWIFMLMWVAATAVIQKPVGLQQESSETIELMRLENVWNEAHMQGNASALDSLWADDLIVTVQNMTVMTKSDAIGMMRSGRMKFKKYQTSDIRIRVYGDAAVVTGQLQRMRSINDREVEDNWQFTKVYIRQAGKWQVVAWQASASPQ